MRRMAGVRLRRGPAAHPSGRAAGDPARITRGWMGCRCSWSGPRGPPAPALASNIAVDAPATRPPTTTTSRTALLALARPWMSVVGPPSAEATTERVPLRARRCPTMACVVSCAVDRRGVAAVLESLSDDVEARCPWTARRCRIWPSGSSTGNRSQEYSGGIRWPGRRCRSLRRPGPYPGSGEGAPGVVGLRPRPRRRGARHRRSGQQRPGSCAGASRPARR